jgi:hypothetical protein
MLRLKVEAWFVSSKYLLSKTGARGIPFLCFLKSDLHFMLSNPCLSRKGTNSLRF